MTRKEDNTPRNNREKGGNDAKKRVVQKTTLFNLGRLD